MSKRLLSGEFNKYQGDFSFFTRITAHASIEIVRCESPGSLPSNFVGFETLPSPQTVSDLYIKCLYSGDLPSTEPNYQPPSVSKSVGFPGVGRIESAYNVGGGYEDYRCYRCNLCPYATSSPTVKATAAPTKKPVGGNPTMKPTVSSKSSKGSKSGGTSGPNSKSAKKGKRV